MASPLLISFIIIYLDNTNSIIIILRYCYTIECETEIEGLVHFSRTEPHGMPVNIDIRRRFATSDMHTTKYHLSMYFLIGGVNLSLYLLVHTWKKEEFKTVGRKVIESVPKLPKGQSMLFSYVDARQTGAWCVYESENTEELKNFWAKNVPEMHLTEVIPIIQFFPPGADSYKLMHIMASP